LGELSPEEFNELEFIVAVLPTESDPEDETAKRFDLIILKLQLATLNKSSSFIKLRDQVKEIARSTRREENDPDG
jgi:type I restriction enzyme, R subunit